MKRLAIHRLRWPLTLILAGFVLAPFAQGGEMRAPGPRSAPRPPLHRSMGEPRAIPPAEESFGSAPWLALLGFYRTTVSAVDGQRCSMFPSCSLYSKQAIEKHGAFLGVLLTADRLLHEADEIPLVPTVESRGKTYYRDPLEANTYWW
jgi:hypothetical protein